MYSSPKSIRNLTYEIKASYLKKEEVFGHFSGKKNQVQNLLSKSQHFLYFLLGEGFFQILLIKVCLSQIDDSH
jgi:hypothetical protein